jgi:hypothetical protein
VTSGLKARIPDFNYTYEIFLAVPNAPTARSARPGTCVTEGRPQRAAAAPKRPAARACYRALNALRAPLHTYCYLKHLLKIHFTKV